MSSSDSDCESSSSESRHATGQLTGWVVGSPPKQSSSAVDGGRTTLDGWIDGWDAKRDGSLSLDSYASSARRDTRDYQRCAALAVAISLES